MRRRVIAVFTGNRAEYGLQFPILKAIDRHPRLDYKLIVSGAHLDPHFGRTLEEIRRDGFDIHAEVTIELTADTLNGTATAIGSGVIAIARVLEDLRPDLMVVYADRFEGFAALIASTQMGIPTAHVEGGDLTQGGALDDSVRHAMTKLAHLHFTTNEQATNRILAMGEERWRVHTVGFPAIDLIQEGLYASSEEIASVFGLDVSRGVVMFTMHSVATQFDQAAGQVEPSLRALRRLADTGVQVIVTYPNNDAGGRRIIECLERLGRENHQNIQLHRSVGRYRYHGLLALPRAVCVGNSSSGIKETPAFGCPAVNIGSRQDGRLRADNVIDVGYDEEDVYLAVRRALDNDGLRRQCRECTNPYGEGDAGEKIAARLDDLVLDDGLIRKQMTIRGEAHAGWFR